MHILFGYISNLPRGMNPTTFHEVTWKDYMNSSQSKNSWDDGSWAIIFSGTINVLFVGGVSKSWLGDHFNL